MRDLDPIFLEKRINNLEKGGGSGEIEHLTEIIESVDNSLIADVEGTDTHFYFDYKDGKLGFNTDEERGADTFTPFSVGGNVIIQEVDYTIGDEDLYVEFNEMTEIKGFTLMYYSGGFRHYFVWHEELGNNNIYYDGNLVSTFPLVIDGNKATLTNTKDNYTWTAKSIGFGL